MRTAPHRCATALLSLAAAAALLSGCDRPTPRQAGNDAGTAVAQAERRADETTADRRQASQDTRIAAGDITDAAGNKVRDMAITTDIHTRLARDPQLDGLSIDVDTAGGHVVLRGNAPDTAARGRATELARGVDGVVSVDNELNVQPRP